MSVESQVNNIADLNPTYPQADDPVSQGDNHIRNIKKALKDTFPNIDGTVTASEDELNQLAGQDLPSDVSALESRVSKNEGDIANNAAGIANNAAGIANNAAGIANNTSAIVANTQRIKDVEVIAVNNEREIQDKADKSYVDIQNSAQDMVIAQKADKSYVDSENNAQDTVIAQKADKSYVDSGLSAKADKSYVDSKNNAQDAVIAQKADKTYVDAQDNALSGRISSLENAPTPGLIPHGINDHTDVNTSGVKNGQALVYKDGVWVPVDILGGGSVNFMTQPTTAGDAMLNAEEQTYQLSGFGSNGNKRLNVPNGAVFLFEYFFGMAGRAGETISLVTSNIIIDGERLHPNGSGAGFTWTETGGSVWPGSEGYTVIVVKDYIQVTATDASPYNDSTISLAGMFSEKS